MNVLQLKMLCEPNSCGQNVASPKIQVDSQASGKHAGQKHKGILKRKKININFANKQYINAKKKENKSV